MAFDHAKLNNPFLSHYFAYVENTEAPRIMHLWSALTAASACLGRHAYFEYGIGNIYPNLYTLLVGPPATKKSTAISLASTFLEEHTMVNFAPDDTAGQRQGLITSIRDGRMEDDARIDNSNTRISDLPIQEQLDMITNMDVQRIQSKRRPTVPTEEHPDVNTIFIEAKEWGSFLGQNSIDLARFLIKLYDGDNYRYALRHEKLVLHKPLASMLGASTPTDISIILPPEVIGQGLMSRIILVFAASRAQRAFRAKLNTIAEAFVTDTFRYLWYEFRGKIDETPEAYKLFEQLYDYEIQITDPRFVYYAERRSIHLLKVSMILAACRRSSTIDANDVEEAHYILMETEQTMPDALGEHGLNATTKARQRLLEFIRYINAPITIEQLWYVMQKDMRSVEFEQTMTNLIRSGRVRKVETKEGTMVAYREVRRPEPTGVNRSYQLKEEQPERRSSVAELLNGK